MGACQFYIERQRVVGHKEYSRLADTINSFYEQQIPRLGSGDISIDSFLNELGEIDRMTVDLACVCTSSFKLYSKFITRGFPNSRIAKHERLHAKAAEKYGLSVIYGLIFILDKGNDLGDYYDMQTGFVVNSLPIDGKQWVKKYREKEAIKMILSYFRDTGNIRGAGETDKIIAKSAGFTLKRLSA